MHPYPTLRIHACFSSPYMLASYSTRSIVLQCLHVRLELCHGGGAATENRAYAGAYFRARLQPSGNGLGRIAPHSGGACPQTLPRRIRLHRRRADVETAQWIRAALLGWSGFVRAFARIASSPSFSAK